MGVRQMLARASPDLVVDQIVVRTELNMRIVMPSVIKHTQKWSYLSMTRFETGSWPYLSMIRFETGSGGNPNFHGFSWGQEASYLSMTRFETGSWPYLSMIRFETGSGGNPNFHGFSWGQEAA